MSDLISRQAAIDALEWKWAGKAAIDAIKNLPPAQFEIIRCKDCKYRILNENYGKKGYMRLKAMCELDTGDPFELGRDAENDDWFCADAERRTDESN